MIKAENLVKKFGRKVAVNKVSLEVNRGDILGFIGPNGAGKSTTMRIITGFIPTCEGAVKIGDYLIEDEPVKAKAMIGYLPENAPLYTNMTVKSFLCFIADIRGLKGAEKKRAIENVVSKCFLEPVFNQTINTLSKGYRHR